MDMGKRRCTGLLSAAAMLLLAGCSGPGGHPASTSASAAPGSAPAQALQPPPAYSAAPATGPDAKVDERIDTLLGNAQAYRDVFDRLQKGLATDDKASVAALVAYPLNVNVHGEPTQIPDAKALLKNWDQIVTPELKQAVAHQQFSKVFVNQDGVMIGNGEVWISGICRDESCSKSVVRITTLQPESS